MNELLKVIRSELTKDVEVVPEGWYTIKQIAAQLKQSDAHIRHKMRVMVKRKKLEMRPFWVKSTAGYRKRIPHYKLSQLS